MRQNHKQPSTNSAKQQTKNIDYFEKQKAFTLQCGMHSVNNLLCKERYNVKDMEKICYDLSGSFINPHKHVFGGDYDANVILLALQKEGYDSQWIDNRKKFELGTYFKNKEITTLGLLLNNQMPARFYHNWLKFSSRHWLAIRPHNEEYAICDSNENEMNVMNEEELQKWIENQKNNGAELIWIFKKND